MHQAPHMLLRSDPASVAGASIPPGLRRRVLRLARPYRTMLIGFVATIIVAAVVDLVPPLLFRRIVDTTIPDKNLAELTVVGVVVVIVAFVSAGLSFAERWWSARIGEGLIYDLRDSLFDHVQRMPVAFFTQTQTGALISRLNNDVIGAQRAFTATLGSVVSNAIVLTTTLVAMLLLEWRLTLLALALLPLFIWPAKRAGRRLAAITREGSRSTPR
ncbi:MAG: ABC transporter transmembrane domain-containing protein [Acidimicrobiales bacterium]